MQVYHGSYTEIRDIDLSQCEPRKDFGKGFYVTNIRNQAEEWAERIGREHNCTGVVTEFTFYENAFIDGTHKVLRFKDYTEEWLDFVVLNRSPQSPIPAHDYDIVEGPVADDRISRRIYHYLKGGISKQDFLNELRHCVATHQICFCTADSLLMLERADKNDINFYIEEIGEPLLETLMLERGIDEVLAADLFYCSGTFARLADSHTGWYKKTWQEIYELLREELEQGN
ncbi:hypothetical protein FACS1894181_01680 [Bacteroidia bacterium]|nr:hypothetical protein FACS1894181_01680 [Bacteroidia bacterium]